MCNPSCIAFARSHLFKSDVLGKRVLEVGALDVNGTVRPVIEALKPASYIGVDIEWGPGVDELCDVTLLTERYGEDVFDVVVSTELAEHVRDWRAAFTNMKRVLRPGGTILITTRSRGFPVHGYPWDYWRYESEDMERIFADFEDLAIELDPEAPGVFVKARRPITHTHAGPPSLRDIKLFSVVARKRMHDISTWDDRIFRLRFLPVWAWAQPLRNQLGLRTRFRRLKQNRRGKQRRPDT